MDVAIGSYVGDGGTSGDRIITGVGFQPKLLFVWCADADAYTGHVKVTQQEYITNLSSGFSAFGENGIVTLANTPTFENIVALGTDGFTIRKNTSQVYNKSGTTFYYLALGGSDIESGTYAGNGVDNRTLSVLTAEPVVVFVSGGQPAADHHTAKFLSSGALVDSSSTFNTLGDSANMIQQILSTGFQVGTSARVNASGSTFYYWAIKPNSRVYQAQYTGNATDNRSITGFGFQPDCVLIQGAGARNYVWRSAGHSGDLSKFYRSAGFFANYIQQFLSDGIEIGTAADVNQNTETFRILAFKTGLDAVGLRPSRLLTLGVT